MSETLYALSFEERENYLYVLVEAESMDIAAVMEYLGRVADRVEEIGATSVIIDRRVGGMLASGDLFMATSDMVKRMQHVSVAIVDTNASHEEPWNFVQIVSENRGGKITVKRTLAEAEQWLLGALAISANLILTVPPPIG